MNANITRTRFIAANELCAKHLGSRIRILTRTGAHITDELIAVHVEVNGPYPSRSVFVQLTTTQPRRFNLPHSSPLDIYFDIAELSDVTVWEPVS